MARGVRIGGFTINSGAGALVAVMVGAAVVLGLARDFTVAHLLLTPAQVYGAAEVWQPFTYFFFPQPSALSVIVGAFIALNDGSALEASWGTRRLWRHIFAVGVTAGLLTVALGPLVPSLAFTPQPGFFGIAAALWVSRGLHQREYGFSFFGTPLTGYQYAAIGAGFVLLNGLFAGFISVLPELLMLAVAAVLVRFGGPARWWHRFNLWRLERSLRGPGRPPHLRSVPGGKRERDSYLN